MIKTNYLDNTSYLPQDLVNQWASLLTDGIYSVGSGAFLVSAHSPANLSVDVAAGAATKLGYYIKSDAVVNIAITANTSGYNRIDIIVLEVDTTNKVTTIKAIAGTPSSSPTAPLPTANQLKIAEVSVGNNVSVINAANITDKRAKTDILDSGLAESSPPGKLSYFARNTAPAGWLKANGAAVSRTAYSNLFAAIGTTFGAGDGSTTFNLPDLRGEFIRGWDDSRGVDSGRAFGSSQADDLKSHGHSLSNSGLGAADGQAGGTIVRAGSNPTGTLTINNTGGTETRPRNIALLACIKY